MATTATTLTRTLSDYPLNGCEAVRAFYSQLLSTTSSKPSAAGLTPECGMV
jgi:hypothetical protein